MDLCYSAILVQVIPVFLKHSGGTEINSKCITKKETEFGNINN